MLLSTRNTLIATLFISPAVLAAPSNSQTWYAGIDAGSGHYSRAGETDAEVSNDRWAVGAHLGYQFNQYVSGEVGYQYLGKASATYADGIISGRFQQLTMAARFEYPMGDYIPFVKVGGSAWDGNSQGLRVGDDTGFSPLAGVGLRYQFDPEFSTQLEYQYTDALGKESIGYADHHLISIGFSWYFDSQF